MLTDRRAEGRASPFSQGSNGVRLVAMGLIYKPFGIIVGFLGGMVAKKIFDFVWTKLDDQEPPKPTTQNAQWGKLLTAAAIQGMIFKTVRTVVDRNAAHGFAYLTGIWPGEKRPDPDT